MAQRTGLVVALRLPSAKDVAVRMATIEMVGRTAHRVFHVHTPGYALLAQGLAALTRGYYLSPRSGWSNELVGARTAHTLESVGNGFARPLAAHLRVSLGLYDVSVRRLAVWTRCFISAQQQVSCTLKVPTP